jgi:hypothetical protein
MIINILHQALAALFFFFRNCAQTGCGAQTAFYQMGATDKVVGT